MSRYIIDKKASIKENQKTHLYKVIYLYWVLLMAWQLFRTTDNRSAIDIAVKLLLILLLTVYTLMEARMRTPIKNIILFLLFAVYMLMLLLIKEPSFSANLIITYCFPVLFAYLFFIHASDYKISKSVYIKFLNLIIITVAVMVGYSLIFSFDNFLNALTLSSAYSNELSSFFLSNHEYALYLLIGSQACIFCYQFYSKEGKKKSSIYVIALLAFISNLILTYSRTALLGLAVMLIVYILVEKNSRIKTYFIIGIVLGALVLVYSPDLQNFVFHIVLKDRNDAGRLVMWEYGLDIFKDSTFFEQIIGRNSENIHSSLRTLFSHGSFHNAYIQVLLQYGVIGLMFFIGVMLSSVLNALSVLRYNRFCGAMFLAMTISAAAYMFSNTTLILQSNIDSYMLTIFVIVLPFHVKNAIISGNFT